MTLVKMGILPTFSQLRHEHGDERNTLRKCQMEWLSANSRTLCTHEVRVLTSYYHRLNHWGTSLALLALRRAQRIRMWFV